MASYPSLRMKCPKSSGYERRAPKSNQESGGGGGPPSVPAPSASSLALGVLDQKSICALIRAYRADAIPVGVNHTLPLVAVGATYELLYSVVVSLFMTL